MNVSKNKRAEMRAEAAFFLSICAELSDKDAAMRLARETNLILQGSDETVLGDPESRAYFRAEELRLHGSVKQGLFQIPRELWEQFPDSMTPSLRGTPDEFREFHGRLSLAKAAAGIAEPKRSGPFAQKGVR